MSLSTSASSCSSFWSAPLSAGEQSGVTIVHYAREHHLSARGLYAEEAC